jgi:hypothetical protein
MVMIWELLMLLLVLDRFGAVCEGVAQVQGGAAADSQQLPVISQRVLITCVGEQAGAVVGCLVIWAVLPFEPVRKTCPKERGLRDEPGI